MKIIGITGRMGSGKTTLANDMSHYMNIPVFDCDEAAKTAYSDNLIKRILQSFYGDKIFHKDNEVNLKAISDIIFTNEQELDFITRLTTPFVLKEYNIFLEKCISLNLFVCAIESSNLIKSKFYKSCDLVLVKVTGDDNINIQRCKNRNHLMNELDITSRLNVQMSEEDMLSCKKTYEIGNYIDFYLQILPKINDLL